MHRLSSWQQVISLCEVVARGGRMRETPCVLSRLPVSHGAPRWIFSVWWLLRAKPTISLKEWHGRLLDGVIVCGLNLETLSSHHRVSLHGFQNWYSAYTQICSHSKFKQMDCAYYLSVCKAYSVFVRAVARRRWGSWGVVRRFLW